MAIDKHTVPRYGRMYNMLDIITSKFKSGTCHFDCLATINCTVKGSRAFLGTTLVRRMDSLQDTVLKLIDRYTKKGIRVGVLTGQGVLFYECDRHTQIQKRAVSVPATQTNGVKKATSGFEAAGKTDAVLQHVLTSGDAGKGPEELH